jgi:hypothetical protein
VSASAARAASTPPWVADVPHCGAALPPGGPYPIDAGPAVGAGASTAVPWGNALAAEAGAPLAAQPPWGPAASALVATSRALGWGGAPAKADPGGAGGEPAAGWLVGG